MTKVTTLQTAKSDPEQPRHGTPDFFINRVIVLG